MAPKAKLDFQLQRLILGPASDGVKAEAQRVLIDRGEFSDPNAHLAGTRPGVAGGLRLHCL